MSGRGWARSTICGLWLPLLLPLPAWAGDGLVALQQADPACATESTDVYVGCTSAEETYNGTVTDNRTGLVWLGDPDCFGQLDWNEAMRTAANLSDLPASANVNCGGAADTCDCGLSDGSAPGEWRLPSIGEWQAMVAAGVAQGCTPAITTDQGIGCNPAFCFPPYSFTCIFQYPQGSSYWAASPDTADLTKAWSMNLAGGAVARSGKTTPMYVWPVRGGQ